jgi:rubrerythrin
MMIYNNNPNFGDCGPFDVDAPTFRLACHFLANEMRPNFETWAQEQEERHAADVMFNPRLPEFMPREKRIAEMRREFLKGLTEVRRCGGCGQSFHADAPERGHADGCDCRGC